MDISSINNNINTTSSSTSLQLDKTSSSNKTSKVQEEGLSLSINDYNKKRDELSLDVQSVNSGIAISKIATNSIEKQQEYLSNIKNKLENIDNIENKNDIKQSINDDLRNFNQIAYETKYKKENLLVNDNINEENNLEINTKKQNFSIEKPNTASYANEIFETINNLDLTNPEAVKEGITKVESSSNQLQNTYDQFTELGNKLEYSARETIKEQLNLYTENKVNKDRNFGKESSDFSKTNISANVGFLVASQANIVQDQSVKLLS